MIHTIWAIALFTLLPVAVTGATIQLSTSTELSSEYTFHQLTVETLPMSGEIARVEEIGTPDYFSPFAITFSVNLPGQPKITAAHVLLNYSLVYGGGNGQRTSQAVQEQCPLETGGSAPCSFTPDEFWGARAMSGMFLDDFGFVGPDEPLIIDLLALGLKGSLLNGTPLAFNGSVMGTFSSGDWLPSGFNSISQYRIEGLTTGSVQAALHIEYHRNPEPATFALAGGPLIGIVWLRRRNRAANS